MNAPETPSSPAQAVTPPRSLVSAAGRAIGDHAMIRDGDRVLLGLSGGKDSLSLLHVLLHLKKRAPVKFELAACTVDPQSPEYDPSPLKAYMAELGVPYFYESQPIVESAEQHMKGDSFCAYCSRLRRGILYRVAREHGCNVLALAQHLDDLAESFLMSAFFGGKLRTMQAHYLNDAGDVRVIRPLVYARERQTRDFAAKAGLPVIFENCPACFSMPMQRFQMKGLLAEQEKQHPKLFASLLTAMKPLMALQTDSSPSGEGQGGFASLSPSPSPSGGGELQAPPGGRGDEA
ncbi:MAG TPA: ATP-binding protein [Thiobacillaceae bacterium]|nr:ATP-binding protein [Thiobacillaceae bacterium]